MCLAIAALGLPASACDDAHPGDRAPTEGGLRRDPPLEVGRFALPDETQGGEPFALQASPDGYLLVYLGYTRCPDLCPTTLADVRGARRRLGDDGARIAVAMITVDPERDRGEEFAEFVQFFAPDGHALRTDDPALLAEVEEAFRARAAKVPTGDGYDIDHTAQTYVVDESGTVVLEWPFRTYPETMARDLRALFEGEPVGEPAEEDGGRE